MEGDQTILEQLQSENELTSIEVKEIQVHEETGHEQAGAWIGHVLRLVFILLIFLTVFRRMMHFGERYVYLGLGLDSLAQYPGHMLMKLPQRFAGWLINFFDYIFTFLHELRLQNFTVVIFDDVSSKMLNILLGWRQKFNKFGVEAIMESKTIKHVAVYLRKSRDDGEFEDVLSKHRDTLLALVENRNWTYRLYEEVASGEKIESRKEMQKLLRHVEDMLYDGAVVMDIDRLGRGENKDWALIKDTFLNSETVIITPNKIYDLEIDNDDVSFDFMSIFARIEFKTIKRRMKQGKEAGAKKGMWTNGKPPFPYYYDKNTRSVLVDETKRPIYRAIVEKYLNGTNLGHIAIWLTDNKIPTPYNIKPDGKNKGWSNITVQRLLASEIHLGYITYGKTRSKRGQVELVPTEERIKVMGTHEKLKTPEEHEVIMERLLKNRMLNPNSRRNIFPLSGLLYCEKCGSRMRFRVGENKKQGQHWSALCYHQYKDGSKCEQRGKVMDVDFFNALYDRIIHVDPDILREIELHGSRYNDTQVIIEVKEQELKKQKRALDKLHESYEEDMITKQVFLERKAIRSRQIQKLEEELKDLRKVVVDEGNYPTVEQIYERISEFRELWSVAVTSEEKNLALKKLVERIVYDREGNRVELTVCYR